MPSDCFRRMLMSALAGLALVLSHVAVAGELTVAVSANDPVRVNLLFSAGADVNEPSRFGMPIHVASGLGALAIIEALIVGGADIEAEGRAGAHLLHPAATKNQPDAVTLLIEHGAKVDSRDRFGFTPFMAALAFPPEGFDAAEVLLASGADPNAQDKADQLTALHWAAGRGRLEVARFLLAKGAAINFRGGSGGTPLQEAVWRRRMEMIGFLVANGADVHAANRAGDTPMDLARGNAEVLKLLQIP